MAGDASFGTCSLESTDELIALPARAVPGVKGTELAGNGRTPWRKKPQSGTKRAAQPWSEHMLRPITSMNMWSTNAPDFVDGSVVNARPLASSEWGLPTLLYRQLERSPHTFHARNHRAHHASNASSDEGTNLRFPSAPLIAAAERADRASPSNLFYGTS